MTPICNLDFSYHLQISITLKRLEPKLREAAHLPPWQMISLIPKVQGELQKIDKLTHIQVR